MVWDEQMGHPSEAARYDKTSVLLLSWDESLDDLEVEKEVSCLLSVSMLFLTLRRLTS